MATVEGFCNVGQHDTPLDADGWCREHNMLGIPPTWGDRRWTWVDGTWQPYKPRPDGWIYKPKYVDPPKTGKAAKTATYRCQWCGSTFTASFHPGGTPPVYCASIHRSAALNARRREARKAVAP